MPAVSVNAVVNMPSLKELNKSVLLSGRKKTVPIDLLSFIQSAVALYHIS